MVFSYKGTTVRSSSAFSSYKGTAVRGFSGIFPYKVTAVRGSSILIRQDVVHSTQQINTNIQAVAVRVTLSFVFTVCSVYIPPNSNIDGNTFDNFLEQISGPVLLLGDFNAHNPLWGSKITNPKGKLLENIITKNDFCLLNDGSDTYMHPGTGTYTAIDLSLTTPDILHEFSWEVHDDLCGSDHFPIIIKITTDNENNTYQRWKLKKADWSTFRTLCSLKIKENIMDYEKPINEFTKIIIDIATKTIPQTSTNQKRRKAWYDDECKNVIKQRKKSKNYSDVDH